MTQCYYLRTEVKAQMPVGQPVLEREKVRERQADRERLKDDREKHLIVKKAEMLQKVSSEGSFERVRGIGVVNWLRQTIPHKCFSIST